MKKLLYVTPHLSTGGLPQYLLKKIRLLKDTYDIYLVEYTNVSDAYVVQKNALKKLLGSKMFTLGDNKAELLSLISTIKPDIIHMEEIPEYFVDFGIAEQIYRKDRSYVIVETTHSSDYDTTKKVFIPDKFMGVCQCTTMQYINHDIPTEIIEFSIDKSPVSKIDARKKVKFWESHKHIVTVGLFTPRKNQGYIFELARQLQDEKIQFHFIGNQADNFKFYWEPIVKNKPSNCIIHGEKSNVRDYLEAADLCVFASKGTVGDMELNPLVIKESLEAGSKLLMYNLDVYLKKYDNNPDVFFLTGNIQEDSNKIRKILQSGRVDEPALFTSKYGADNKIYLEYHGQNTIKTRVSIADLDTNLTYYAYDWAFEPNNSYWIVPFATEYLGTITENSKLNGFTITIYEEKSDNIIAQNIIRLRSAQPPTDFVFKNSPFDQVGYSYLDMFHRGLCDDLKFDDGVVIDAGANVGIFTLLALSKGAKKVYSIEPDPRIVGDLTANFGANDKVKILDYALTTTDGTKEFYLALCTVASSLVRSDIVYPVEPVTVKAISIQKLLSEIDDTISVLKLDIEGEEFAVIDAMQDSDFKKVKSLFIEYHLSNREKLEPMVERLRRLGYDIKFLLGYNLDSSMGFFVAESRRQSIDFTVEPSYERDTNKILFNYIGPPQELCFSIRDLNSNVPIYYTNLNFPGNSYGWWIVPVRYQPFESFMDKPYFSGFRLDIFDAKRKNLLKTVDMKLKTDYVKMPNFKISAFDCAYINFEEFFANKVYDEFVESIGPINVAVDIGANIGVFTNYLLYKGAKKVFCVEPEPDAINSLKYSLDDNENVTIVPYAIANSTGTREFNTAVGNTTVSSFYEEQIGNYTNSGGILVKESVNTITFKKFLEDYKVEKIDFLKIDVEGAEYEIFDTLEKEDFDRIDNILLEFHMNKDGRLRNHILNKLDEFGYEYEAQYSSKTEKMDIATAIDLYQGSLLIRRKGSVKVVSSAPEGRAFITHCNSTYIPLVKHLVNSLLYFTKLPIIVYGIDCDVDIVDPRVEIRRIDTDILDPKRGGRLWYSHFSYGSETIPADAIPGVDGKDANAYKMLSLKPTVMSDALSKGLKEGIYIDSDALAKENIEDLYQYFPMVSDYPIVGEGVHNFLILDGKWPIENDLMELFGVTKRSMHYVASNVMLFNQNCKAFIDEWKLACENKQILTDPKRYAPFQDETVLNVLLWKHNATEKLPLVHYNARNSDSVKLFYTTTKRNDFIETEWQKMPANRDDVKIMHGCKSPVELQKIFDYIVSLKTK